MFAAPQASADLGFPDEVTEFFDSGAGPIPGPYGSDGGGGPEPIDVNMIVGRNTVGYLSLPTGSFVTLKFVDELVEDRPGVDLEIIETGNAAEEAEICVSSDGVTFTLLGVAAGNSASEFDLAAIGYTDVVSHVRVVGLDSNGSSPGFDLVRIEAPQFTFNSTLFAETLIEYFDSGAGPIDGPYGGPDELVPVPVEVVLGPEPGPFAFNDFLSLPQGSFVIVGFDTGTMIDGPGNDVFINEAVVGGEDADVSVSTDGVNFVFLGIAGTGGVTSFDLADIGVTDPVIAVRVEGLDNGGSSPGFDLIGVGVFPGSIGPPLSDDTDSDGVADGIDNCRDVANSDQIDADVDQFGNRCDADFNNDCIVNAVDLGYFRTVFFSADPLADLNSDGTVNAVDLGIFRTLFFSAPGPSGFGACVPGR